MRRISMGFLVVFFCLGALPTQPVTDSSFPQRAILHASDPQSDDSFGFAVAISGDTAVVGAYSEDGGAGDSAPDSGTAYVFQRQAGDGAWSQVARLTATVPEVVAGFGFSVAISGDIVIVGAPWEEGASSTLGDAGAAYLFGRDQGGADKWGLIKRLSAIDEEIGDEFGYSVAISGKTAIVGARNEDGGDLDPTPGAGAAYVFQQIDTFPWLQITKITASDADNGDSFGSSVALSGDLAVVGAIFKDGGPSGSYISSGAAYLFDRDQGGTNLWGEVEKLTASDAQTSDQFGGSVAISGDTVICGAHNEDGGLGDPLTDAGAAYVFQDIDTFGWFEIEKLTALDAQADDEFGGRVTISGDMAIVGSRYHDGGFPNGKGAAYVFVRHLSGANNWGQAKQLLASDARAGDWFGSAVAISGGHAIVGAFEEDGGPGNPFSGAGAAYLFRMSFLGFFHAGAAVPGSLWIAAAGRPR